MKRGGEHGRPADQHRRQHGGCRAEMEQRHRGPQHVARTEFPGRRDRRGRGEQVMPGRGNRLRRPGGARREEQAADVVGRPRRRRGSAPRRFQRLGERIPLHQNVSHGLHLVGDLIDAGMRSASVMIDLGARQPQRCAAGTRPCWRHSPRRSPRRSARHRARSTPTRGRCR